MYESQIRVGAVPAAPGPEDGLAAMRRRKKIMTDMIPVGEYANNDNEPRHITPERHRATRILLVEDCVEDALLLEATLRTGGLDAEVVRVDSGSEMARCLEEPFDLVISDYSVPGFGASEALRLLQASGRDLPFIIVSGTVGEETAVEMMRAGARDYVMKDNLRRLAPAIRRELQEVCDRERRRAAETSLEEVCERFQATFEQAGIGVAHVTPDGQFLDVNEKLALMLGADRAEIMGTSGFEWIHPEDREASRQAIDAIGTRGIRHCETETRMLRRDGTIIDVVLSTSVVLDDAGMPKFAIVMFNDVSERKRAEWSLREKASLLAATLEAAAEALVVTDLSGRILAYNRRLVEIMNFPPGMLDDPDGRPALEYAVAQIRNYEDLLSAFRALKADPWSEDSGQFELVDGRTIEWYAAPQLLDGVPVGRVRSLRDITARVADEAERERLAHEKQLLLDAAAEGIVGIDRDGICTFANRAAASILGYSESELIGQLLHDLVHYRKDDGSPFPAAECQVYLAPGEGETVAGRAVYWKKDGSPILVDRIASPLVDQNEVQGAVILFSDVTEQVALERKLEQANRVRCLGRVAATAAHEFNNVLMGILPFTEVVRRVGAENERLTAAADFINRSVQRGRRVAEEILRFTNQKEPVLAEFDLGGCVRQVAAETASTLGEDCQIELELPDHPVMVHADQQQLEQVIVNLLLNARDAMEGRGRVTLRLETSCSAETVRRRIAKRRDMVDLSCHDTGSGIPPEVLDRIFEPLFTTKRNGTGLGLAVAQQVMTQHGGEIVAESRPGEGTTFHLLVPSSGQRQREQ